MYLQDMKLKEQEKNLEINSDLASKLSILCLILILPRQIASIENLLIYKP